MRGVASAAIALLALVAPSGAVAGFPGENGRIAISAEWSCDGGYIKTVRPNGSGLKSLGVCDARDRNAVWTADGQALLLRARPNPEGQDEPLMTMDADGGDREIIPVPEGDHPYPSPSGDRFVYERFDLATERVEIWMANFDGSGLMRLRAGRAPRFSPDGTTIAFTTRRGLWLMDLDGMIIRRITRAPVLDWDWSPTGRSVAYTKDIETGTIESASDLYRIDVNGQNRRRLSHSKHKYESSPAWSPDGRWIAFVRTTTGKQEHYREIRKKPSRGGIRSTLVMTPPRFIERASGSLYPTTLSWQPRP